MASKHLRLIFFSAIIFAALLAALFSVTEKPPAQAHHTAGHIDVINITPTNSSLARPTNLQHSCAAGGTSVTLSWNAVSGATNYILSIDETTNNSTACHGGWDCGGTDYLNYDYPSTTYTHTIRPNTLYVWWVHGDSSSGYGQAEDDQFTCSSTVLTPTATLTANGQHNLTVNAGDTINFQWNSTNALAASSVYSVNSHDSCSGPTSTDTGPFTWVANTLSGSTISTVQSCQTGRTYTYTYAVANSNSQSAADTVTITVAAPTTPPPPPPPTTLPPQPPPPPTTLPPPSPLPTTPPPSFQITTVFVSAPSLNVRSAPSLSATIVQKFTQGQQFYATDFVAGESIDGNQWWWERSDKTYVWSGGAEPITSTQPAPAPTPTPTPTPLLTQCADTHDNDNDGRADYPNDPGCSSATDNDEISKCADSIDNDGDGRTDASDLGCLSQGVYTPSDNDEFDSTTTGGGSTCIEYNFCENITTGETAPAGPSGCQVDGVPIFGEGNTRQVVGCTYPDQETSCYDRFGYQARNCLDGTGPYLESGLCDYGTDQDQGDAILCGMVGSGEYCYQGDEDTAAVTTACYQCADIYCTSGTYIP